MSVVFNYVRKAVSGDRRRYKDGSFDLDLSYVTDRIVAMGFPGSGIEGTYRNNIDVVSRFLNEKHSTNYMVFNLSDRKYDYGKFNHQVVECGFWDHHPPPLRMLFEICHRIYVWLSIHHEHIAVIHCIAGKGRTGLVISSYLYYMRLSNSIWQGLYHFAVQRSETEEGVSMPSQIRYAYLFSGVVSGELKIHPRAMVLREIVISGSFMPRFERNGFRPLLHIYSGRKLIHSSQWQEQEGAFLVSLIPGQEFTYPCRCLAFGDITIHMYHAPAGQLPYPFKRMNSLVFRCSLHTSFIEQSAVQFDNIPENLKPQSWARKRHSGVPSNTPAESRSTPPQPIPISRDLPTDREAIEILEDVPEYSPDDYSLIDRFNPSAADFSMRPSNRLSSISSKSIMYSGWREICVKLLKDDLDGPHADSSERYPDDFSVTLVFECPPSSEVDSKLPEQVTESLLRRRDAKPGPNYMIDGEFKMISLQSYIDDLGKHWRKTGDFGIGSILPAFEASQERPVLPLDPQAQTPSPETGEKSAQGKETSLNPEETPNSPPYEIDYRKSSSNDKQVSHVPCQAMLAQMMERMHLLQMENDRLRGLLDHRIDMESAASVGDIPEGSVKPRTTSSSRVRTND